MVVRLFVHSVEVKSMHISMGIVYKLKKEKKNFLFLRQILSNRGQVKCEALPQSYLELHNLSI